MRPALILGFGVLVFNAALSHAQASQCRVRAQTVYEQALAKCGADDTEVAQTCVDAKTCDSYYGDGSCREWVTSQICGRFCASGRECDNRYGDGTCRQWRPTGACGSRGCTTGKVCDNRYGDGSCREWAQSVTCH